jgi:PncC family amidohydrolase
MSEAGLLVRELKALGKKAVLAESCTAGLAADMIASVPGASEVLWGSFVTYSLDAKRKLLGVPDTTLRTNGAVSRETACAMAQGALEKSGADYAVSVTGLAGPGGDGSDVSVGTVWIAVSSRECQAEAVSFHFEGSRNEIRREAAGKALEELLRYLEPILNPTISNAPS